ncbi:hypothetical protein DMUE_2900 [Dictyocoela muelleri]|nr:hypothetical protein DMUE_2900 [Dictyocoela muelleri]
MLLVDKDIKENYLNKYMVNNFYYSFLVDGDDSHRKTNQRSKTSSKPVKIKEMEQPRRSLSNQNDQTAYSQVRFNKSRLVKGMCSRDADVQIYMMCLSKGFKDKDLEQQYLSIVEQSDKLIQNCFF